MTIVRGVWGWINLVPGRRFTAWLLLLFVDLILVRSLVLKPQHVFLSQRYLVNYLGSLVVLYALVWLLQCLFRVRGYGRIAGASAFLAVPLLLELGYAAVYGRFVGSFIFGFALENAQLSLGLAGGNIAWIRVILALLLTLVSVYWLLPPSCVKGRRSVWAVSGGAITGILAIGWTLFGAFHWTGVPEYQHPIAAFFTTTAEAVKSIHLQATVDRQEVTALPPLKHSSLPDIVWVIGESLVREHMSLYGYGRATTPALVNLHESGRLRAFRDVIAAGTRTRSSVPMILTGLQGADPNGSILRRPTIFDYAKARGYHTAFISAQEMSWGNLDELFLRRNVDLLRSGADFDSRADVLKGADDAVVFHDGVIPWLRETPSPRFLVIQMDGSHYPYSEHSPVEAKVYLPESDPNGVNAYDNTVRYSDRFLGELSEYLQSQGRDFWLFITTDHGQDIDSADMRFNSTYTDQTVRVFLAVVSSLENLRRLDGIGDDALLTHSDVFSTTLDLWGAVAPEDGRSLFAGNDNKRIRVSTAYVRTWHNEPTAAVFPPNGAPLVIDFARGRFQRTDSSEDGSFDELDASLREVLLRSF